MWLQGANVGEEIHVDSDNMFPPAVGLCLAFVLIPSHHWVQAPGPPTQLCQRLPGEGAQIWPGSLNYHSAPTTRQIRTVAAETENHSMRTVLKLLGVFSKHS